MAIERCHHPPPSHRRHPSQASQSVLILTSYTPNHHKLILSLQHPRQQSIEEEDLRQGYLRDQDVVPELVGALAAAGEAVEVVEEHPVTPAAEGLEDLVLVDAVDAAVEAEVGLLRVGLEELVLTISVTLSVTSSISKNIRRTCPSSLREPTDIPPCRGSSETSDVDVSSCLLS